MKKLFFVLLGVVAFTNSQAQWQTSGNNIYYNTGLVGIGRIPTTWPLELSSAGTVGLRIHRNVTTTNLGSGLAFAHNDAGGTLIDHSFIYGHMSANTTGAVSSYMTFYTMNAGTAAEKMRLSKEGWLGIGTTPSQLLHVYGDGGMIADRNNASSGSYLCLYRQHIPKWVLHGGVSSDRFSIGRYIDSTAAYDYNTFNIVFSNGYLGLGTVAPTQKLVVDGNIYTTTTSVDKSIRVNRGSFYDEIGVSSSGGYIKALNSSGVTNIMLRSYGDSYFLGGNIGIGVSTPTEKLVVDGKIVAEEVIVQVVNPSDYVFNNDYPLKSLDDVEQYVHLNKHLPDVPSGTEQVNNGVSLGEMNNVLLKKIEELILYVIDQNKKIDKLTSENTQIQNEVAVLKEVINNDK